MQMKYHSGFAISSMIESYLYEILVSLNFLRNI